MRRTWRITRHERESRPATHPALISVPFLLLFAFLIAVKSADSSSSFRIDEGEVLARLRQRIAETAGAPAAPETQAVAEPAESEEFRQVKETVRKGDTLGVILHRIGVGSDEVTRWSETTHRYTSLTRLKTGHSFTFLIPSGTDRLAGLQYELSTDSLLVMREEAEAITAEVEHLSRMSDIRAAAGVIDSSLYASATKQGVPESVISSIVDIFGWEIDFSSDLQSGDTYRIIYEGADDRRDGGRVLAAELVIGGKRWDAVYFEGGDDGGNYYTPDGKSFGRSFLRYPVEFTRISSSFTTSRFHPLLGVNRPHLGVDFAAPIGTPIRAIAGGRVEYAGWHGGSGRYIRIDHGAGLESSYSHLQAISRDVRAGSRVQVGQVIGRVGASGLATGPHLHFALFRNGEYVNPLRVKLPASPPLSKGYTEEFARVRDQLLEELSALTIDGAPGGTRVASAPAGSMSAGSITN